MADEYLNGVTVKFEKGYGNNPDVKIEEKSGSDGPYKMYTFQSSFKDETGQTKTHKTKSFTAPGAVDTSQTGSVKLYHGDYQGKAYISYTFYPDEDQTATTEEARQEVPPKSGVPPEAPEGEKAAKTEPASEYEAVKKYVDFVWSVCKGRDEEGNPLRSDEAAAAIFPGVRMIVGDYTTIYTQELDAANIPF